MLETKRTSPIIALIGAVALLSSAPVLAQTAAPAAAPAPAAAAPATPAAGDTGTATPDQANAESLKVGGSANGRLTPIVMFEQADLVVKIVMIGLLACSILSWTLLVIKLVEFGSLRRTSDRFLESFRGAKSINEMGRIAESEDFAGNPMADMAAAAAAEVELSRQAGLNVTGEFRDSTLMRATTAINAVQASLARRLSGGMQFLASVGANAPFIGLFGTVYGIMNSFIGIANTNTTNLAVVAPGIAQALLATGIGLFAAIPSVVFYNYFQTQITGYGSRSEGFVAELINAISRQLDKGA
ncbi:MAG TPA: MotA/TolQ/ExbB proton channel family protein [Caulobacteraceae bacterium]|jgi:biopolymer transport protein ExbB|nr:MotA/TolQ/ExbB proton channel family protein [Caulobacteraceae bacterium]